MSDSTTLKRLRVVIEAYTRPYQQEMDQVRSQTAAARRQVENETAKMSRSVNKIGSVMKTVLGVVSVAAIAKFGKSCIDLGSDLAEVQNVVDVTFGSISSKVDEFSKNAIAQFGLSETMAKKYVGTYGAMSKAFGFSTEQAYDMSAAVTGLTGDVASFYNITQDEAYTKLKSIWTGETESLKDLGVVMTQTALDQYAMNNGFGKTTAKMTEQEKVMLRYQFVMGQLGAAQGDFARTSGGWANQVRVLQLQFESLRATIGQGLINVFTPVIKLINGVIAKLQVAANAFKSFTDALFGKSSQQNSSIGGDLSSGTGQAADNAGDMSDNLGSAADNAKKIEKAMMGFDEINKLSKADDSADSNSGGGNTSVPGYGGLDGSVLGDVNKELDEVNKKAQAAAKVVKNFLKGVREAAEPTTKALKKLWNEGLSKLGKFTWTTIEDFWNNFLKPMGKWALGDKGLPRFLNITNDLLNKINWSRLNGSLATLAKELQKPAKFVWTALMDFYEGFLKPVAAWAIGEGLPRLFDVCSDLISKINWDGLNDALKDLWEALGPFAVGVGKGLVSFIEKMADVLSPVISVILNGISEALKFFAGVIKAIPEPAAEAIGGAIGGICTALLGFKAARTISGVIVEIKDALTGFLGMIMAHPYIAIAAGIAGLAGALISFADATMSDPEFDAWSKGMDELNESLKNSNEEIRKMIKQADKWKGAGEAEGQAVQDLADKYFELKDKANKTNEEKEKMKRLAEDLVGYLPELKNGYYDPETKLITAQKDQVQGLIDKMVEQYKLEAAKESLIEYEKARLEAYENISEASEKVAEGTQLLKEKEEALKIAQEENAKQNEAMGQSSATLTPEVVRLKDEISEARNKLDENKKSMQGLMDEYNESEAKIDTVTEYLYGMGESVDDTSKKADGLTRAYALMIDDVGGIFQNGKQVLGKKAVEIYKGIESGLYKDNGKGFYDIGNGMMVQFGNSLGDKKPEAKSMAESIGKETAESLDSGAQKGITAGKEGAKTAFKGWAAFSVSGYKEKIQDMEPEMADEMSRFSKGLGIGFSSALPDSFAETFNFFGNMNSKITSSIGDLTGVGKESMQGLANGINSVSIPLPHIDVGWNEYSIGDKYFSTPTFGMQWYARGGFPDKGQMFVANEAGPEMIGKMGSRNVVANNRQITEGIKAAVVDGMIEVMMGSNQGKDQPPVVEFTLVVDSETAYKLVKRGKEKFDGRYNIIATV